MTTFEKSVVYLMLFRKHNFLPIALKSGSKEYKGDTTEIFRIGYCIRGNYTSERYFLFK